MLRCCLCQSLGASDNNHDTSRLNLLLDHARIHNSEINRYAKVDILKIFADCFPEIAAECTVREIVDSMEASRNSGSNDGVEGKTGSVPVKTIKKAPQRRAKILVKNSKKRSQTNKQGKRFSWQPQKISSSVHVQCRKILEASCGKNHRRFRCVKCDDLVVLRGQRGGFDTWCAIGHVMSRHMDIKPFRCRYCEYTAKTRFSMSGHVKRTHQTPDYRSVHFISELDAHKKEICDMVATCFGKKQWKASKSEPETKIKVTKQDGDTTMVAGGNQSATSDEKRNRSYEPSMIAAHCQETMAPYSKEQHRLKCSICDTLVTLRHASNARLDVKSVLQHVVGHHMDIKPFRCRYCTADTKTQSGMCRHVKNAHKLAASCSVHYINETSVHEKAICEMITKCFGKKDQVTSTKTVKINLQRLQDTKGDVIF